MVLPRHALREIDCSILEIPGLSHPMIEWNVSASLAGQGKSSGSPCPCSNVLLLNHAMHPWIVFQPSQLSALQIRGYKVNPSEVLHACEYKHDVHEKKHLHPESVLNLTSLNNLLCKNLASSK